MTTLYTKAEFDAALAAIKAEIAEKVPAWEASWIPDAAVESAVAAGLNAAAEARAKEAPKQT